MKHFNTLKQLLLIPLLVLTASLSALAQPLSGVYTIGGTSPNYATLAAAVADLNTKGVSGKVWFNIRTGTYTSTTNWVAAINGTYPGATDPNARVTFQAESGNKADVTITNANTSSVNYIFRFNSANYITVRNLTLNSTSTSYSKLIDLVGTSTKDSVYNCNLTGAVVSTTSTDAAVVYGSGFSGAGNVFSNNVISNGSYGIYLYGSTSPMPASTVVAGNTITGQYNYGANLYYMKDLQVTGNTITKTANTTTYYAVYLYNCTDALKVLSNTVTMTGTSSSHYGIYASYCTGSSSVVANRGAFKNNNITMTTTTGTQYGIYFNSYNSYDSVTGNILNQTATSGTINQMYNYWYNTYMYMTGNTLNATATTGTIYNYPSYYYCDYSVFSNNVVNETSTTGTLYPMYYAGYNSFYTNTSNNTGAITATTTGTVYVFYNALSYGSNNTISGNNFAITQNGSGSKNAWYNCLMYSSSNNTVTNNTTIFGGTGGTGYCYGMYQTIYSSSNNNNFSGNVMKFNTASTGTQYGWYYSVYSSCLNNTVNNNTVEIINTATSGTHYGMYYTIYSSCNNTTYNGNTLKITTAGTGTVYGAYYSMYSNTSPTMNNNTWYFERTTNTSGTMYGFYYSNAYNSTSSNFNNNTYFTSNGSGTTYGHYYSHYSQPNQTYNNNTVTVNATSGTLYPYYYSFTYCDNQIMNNNIINATNAASTNYGLYNNGYSSNMNFNKNTLNIKAGGSGTCYGMYLYNYGSYTGGTFNDNKIFAESGSGTTYAAIIYYQRNSSFKNNVMNVNTTGTNYTVYPNYCENLTFTNNTFNTNGTSGTSYAAYVYQYPTTPVFSTYWYNNIFSKTRASGPAVQLYTWEPGHIVEMDYNNFYSKNTAAIYPVVTVQSWWNVNNTGSRTLHAWRNLTNGDKGSIAYNPGYRDSTTDLRPDPARSESWSVNGRGNHITGNNVDILGNARVTTKAAGVPDLGAYEFSPTSIPPLSYSASVPTASSTQYYLFGQDTVMTIAWPATPAPPTDLEVRQYTGVVAPGVTTLGPTFMYMYVDAQPVGGTAPFTSDTRIHYMDPMTGTTAESALRMAQKDGTSAWIAHPHTSSGASAYLNYIYKTGLTNFGLLTGADIANNAGALDIVTPSPLFCAGTYTLTTKIANLGNNTINTVQVGWQIDGGAISTTQYTTPILSQAAGVNTANVTLGSITFTNKAKVIKIWTSGPNNVIDPVPMDDTITLRWGPGLSGEYTVGGTSPDYATVADAVADLKKFGVCDNVWFNVRPGTYTGQYTLTNVTGMSATKRVTFKSENGIATGVTLTTPGAFCVKIDNAHFYTLKNMSIMTTGTSSGYGVQFVGTCNKDSIVGMNISVATNTSSNCVPIYASSVYATDMVILNNTTNSGYYGMYLYGYSNTTFQNSVIRGNTVLNTYYYSIIMYGHPKAKIQNNIINTTSLYGYHLYPYYCDGAEVSGNQITLPNNTYAGLYLYNCIGTAANPNNVFNNVIVMGGGSTTSPNGGMYCWYSPYTNYYNNSVSINHASQPAGYFYNGSGYDNNTFNNNVFANYGGGPAMLAVTPTGTNKYDYNNYYTTGSKVINPYSGTGWDSLTLWRIAENQDKNSISYDPGFMTSTNLVPDVNNQSSWSLNGRGVHITGNNKDFNGNNRVVNRADGVPDIGAFEFTPQTIPPVAKATPATVVAGGTQVFTFGQDTVAKIKWDANTYVPSTVTIRQWTGTLPPSFPTSTPMYFYTDIDAVAVTYINDADIYYKDPWTGKIPAAQEANIRMLRKESSSAPWTAYNGTSSVTNTGRNTMAAATITGLGYFTGIQNDSIFSANIKPLAPVVFCPGGSVTLQSGFSGPNYTHQWVLNTSDIPGATNPTYTAVMAGDYSVRVIETASSRSVTSNKVAVTIVSTPAAVITPSGPTTICTGNNVTLNASTGSGHKYQWMINGVDITGATNPSYLVTTGGTFSVKVKNIGCTNLSSPITVVQGPVSVNLGNDTSFCTASPLHLDALNPGARYMWSTGDTSQTITISSYGKHKIAVHVDAGVNCIAKDTIEVEISPMPSVVGISSIRQFGNTYKFEPSGSQYVESYLWIFGDGSTDTTSSIMHEYNGGVFDLKLVVFNGCGSDTVDLHLPTNVKDLTKNSDFELYPNPAKSSITLAVHGEAQFNDVVIVNSIGQIVLRQSGTNTKNRTFDIRTLPDGHYFIRANTNDDKIISKPFQIIR